MTVPLQPHYRRVDRPSASGRHRGVMTTILRLFGLVAISIAVAGCHEQPKKVSDMSAREQQRLRDQLRDDAEVHACASSGVPRLDKNETLVDDRIKIWVRQKTPKLLHHIEDKYG